MRLLAIFVCVILLGLLVTGCAHATPIAVAEGGGIRLYVYDEPCALKMPTNLPKRATWTENGKTFEGCYSVRPDGLAMFFFEDGSVVALPVQAFKQVQGV